MSKEITNAHPKTSLAMVTLLEEALPSVSGSALIFNNAPAGTREIWLTLRDAGLTIRTDGGVPTASVNGSDFAADTSTPYVFKINRDTAILFNAIQNGGTATGWTVYLG